MAETKFRNSYNPSVFVKKKWYLKDEKTFMKGKTGTFKPFYPFSEKKLIRDIT